MHVCLVPKVTSMDVGEQNGKSIVTFDRGRQQAIRSWKVDAGAILGDLSERPFDNNAHTVATLVEGFLFGFQMPSIPNDHVRVRFISGIAVNRKRTTIRIESIFVKDVDKAGVFVNGIVVSSSRVSFADVYNDAVGGNNGLVLDGM